MEKKGGKKERKRRRVEATEFLLRLYLHPPPFHPPFAVFSYSIFSAPSVLSERLSRLFKTHPTRPPVVVRPGHLVQNKRCFSLRPYSPLRYVRQNPIAINHNTVVEYNAADIANGGLHNKKLYAMSGKLLGNVIGDVRKQLMDPDNMDFRPKQGSSYIQEDVGPYNYEESKTKYWIPGRIQYKVTWGCVCLKSCGFIYYYAVSTR